MLEGAAEVPVPVGLREVGDLPKSIGRYEILCRLGHGGMATVYLGRAFGPAGFERLFAIKMIHEHLCNSRPFVKMFLEEARLAARIYHPNIAPVYEVSEDRGRYFIAMDYVSGETLANLMSRMWNERLTFPFDLAAHLALNVCEALHAAHELRDGAGTMLGVIHRDVSPQNILVGYDGIIRVVDFGVAKAKDQPSYTLPGTQKGTLAYMAPEQFLGVELDRRADIFSLGVVLWEMTIGRRLFKAKTDVLTADKVRATIVPPPSGIREGYPGALERIVLKALMKSPEDRHQTARSMGDELRGFLVEKGYAYSAALVERLMKDVFADRLEKRADLERKALQAKPAEPIDDYSEPENEGFDVGSDSPPGASPERRAHSGRSAPAEEPSAARTELDEAAGLAPSHDLEAPPFPRSDDLEALEIAPPTQLDGPMFAPPTASGATDLMPLDALGGGHAPAIRPRFLGTERLDELSLGTSQTFEASAPPSLESAIGNLERRAHLRIIAIAAFALIVVAVIGWTLLSTLGERGAPLEPAFIRSGSDSTITADPGSVDRSIDREGARVPPDRPVAPPDPATHDAAATPRGRVPPPASSAKPAPSVPANVESKPLPASRSRPETAPREGSPEPKGSRNARRGRVLVTGDDL